MQNNYSLIIINKKFNPTGIVPSAPLTIRTGEDNWIIQYVMLDVSKNKDFNKKIIFKFFPFSPPIGIGSGDIRNDTFISNFIDTF